MDLWSVSSRADLQSFSEAKKDAIVEDCKAVSILHLPGYVCAMSSIINGCYILQIIYTISTFDEVVEKGGRERGV